MRILEADILVLGSGLAGLSAAIVARRSGCHVIVLSEGGICSGSSFSSRTWGLGFVTPGPPGAPSLAREMSLVGGGVNDPQLTNTLCARAEESVAFLESLGARLERPRNPEQLEFVPCFDSLPRSWHGFVPHTWAPLLTSALTGARPGSPCAAPAVTLSNAHVLSLLTEPSGRVVGCLALDASLTPTVVLARETIVATGGYAGLWGSHLCAGENRGIAHVLAHDAGASLVNLEFVQLMLGVDAKGGRFVHNEKGFRWTRLLDARTGRSVFAEMGVNEALVAHALEVHAGHGPFTSRLESALVEETLARFRAAFPGRDCVARLDESFLSSDERPEFVDSYLSWMRDALGIPADEPLPVRECAHSCNGGIQIDASCRTSVPGLLACGEAAGGVHGADRIGGLASVAAVTFGRIAGSTAAEEVEAAGTSGMTSAAREAGCDPQGTGAGLRTRGLLLASPPRLQGPQSLTGPDMGEPWRQIGAILDENCLVLRTDVGLGRAERELGAIRGRLAQDTTVPSELVEALPLLDGLDKSRLRGLCAESEQMLGTRMACALTSAMRARTESRGSHYRADFPKADPVQDLPHHIAGRTR